MTARPIPATAHETKRSTFGVGMGVAGCVGRSRALGDWLRRGVGRGFRYAH
jgi:hypothetical protein